MRTRKHPDLFEDLSAKPTPPLSVKIDKEKNTDLIAYGGRLVSRKTFGNLKPINRWLNKD